MKTASLYARRTIIPIRYACPHCTAVISYDTDRLPSGDHCQHCLKPLTFNIIYRTPEIADQYQALVQHKDMGE
jgi:hypothetical protein